MNGGEGSHRSRGDRGDRRDRGVFGEHGGHGEHGGRSGRDAGAGRFEDQVRAGPGGVMTDEVGVITGDLTLVTRSTAGGRAAVDVTYTGAEEWYTLTGSPAAVPPGGLKVLHEHLCALVRHGGGAQLDG